MTPDIRLAAFLSELTRRHQNFLVWKHLDRALLGKGDIDAAAPVEDTEGITSDAISMAAEMLGATHVIACTHVADKRLNFFVQPERLPQLFELDVCTQPSRGLAPWANPRLMVPLATVSPDGIRRLRPGAEAVVSIVYHGLSPRGRHRLHGEELAIVLDGLAHDFLGAELACAALAPLPARRALHELVLRLTRADWHLSSARQAYGGFVLSGLAHPEFTLRRATFRLRLANRRDCIMSELARHHDRLVPATGLAGLLATARTDGHAVIEL